jgi:diaminopropionate ammonia-lyase
MTTLTRPPGDAVAELICNRRFRGSEPYGEAERLVLAEADAALAFEQIRLWPDYRPTVEVELAGLARRLGISGLRVKPEGQRFAVGSFKVLGPPYAAMRLVAAELRHRHGLTEVDPARLIAGDYRRQARDIVLMAATSGNHGRALAWAAQKFGCRARIYMRDGVSVGREQAIRGFGAEVVRVPGSFDDALARCQADAEREGGFVIADLPLARYPDVPRHTLHGYSVLASELIAAWAQDGKVPSHVFVSAGVGTLAAATVGRLWQALGAAGPRVVVVEPLAAAGILRSAEAGRLADADGDLLTLMDGLAVRAVSPFAWTILERGAYAFLGISDEPAVEAMRLAADNEPPVVIGESGIAALAGLLVASRGAELRDRLGIDRSSLVSVIACEGATDPVLYHTLTGRAPAGKPR